MNAARIVLVCLLPVVTSLAVAAVAQESTRRLQGRELAVKFGQSLRYQLQRAMDAGGPAQAIKVCKDEAPRIASELSRQSGAKVRRTSLRYRNPDNAPQPWEADAIAQVLDIADDPGRSALEYFVSLDDGSARYMRAIPTAPICLTCHGTTLTDDVKKILDKYYPDDRARNFSLNDIRGAYSISWPARDDRGLADPATPARSN